MNADPIYGVVLVFRFENIFQNVSEGSPLQDIQNESLKVQSTQAITLTFLIILCQFFLFEDMERAYS